MPRFAICLLATSLVLAPLTAGAATPGAVQAGQSAKGQAKGGKLANLLSPEQRAMYALETRDQIKAMPQDQRKAFHKEQVRKLMTMSPGDRQNFQKTLQAKWDALPQKQKARFERRLAGRANRQAAQ
jgi:hypothetical protein